VEEFKWISREEMMDQIAIAQSCPGVMAVNSATIIGYHLAGVPGAVLTALGSILPPMIILSVISVFYKQFRDNRIVALILKGMQAGVAAVLISLSISMSRTALEDKKALSVFLFAAAVAAVVFLGIDVIYAILFCGFAGGLNVLYEEKKRRNGK
jgi:chromate transporter